VTASGSALEAIAGYIDRSRQRYINELSEYLRIPSVSAIVTHREDLRRCAVWTAEALTHAGLDNVRVIETAGNPIVYGDWLHARGAPTVLSYGHYDVQPTDPIDLWKSAPFEPTVRDGRIFARGATDDKGQLFIHVKAVEAHLRCAGRLPVNIKIIVEGEEEVGGAQIRDFVRRNRDMLSTDVVVISDTAMFSRGVPSICYALRGLVYFQLDVRGTSSDLHSGSFGGAVANPALVLAGILARLKDASGRVTIPGFYDDVLPLTDEQRSAFATLPFDEHEYADMLGAPALFGESGYTILERVWARPTLDVNGLMAGFSASGAKTIIPATAMAKLSMRLVPNQSADTIARLFEAFADNIVPNTVTLKVTRLNSGDPWMARVDNGFVQAAARAMEHGFGKPPVFIREGGSNPIVLDFERELGAPVVMFGIGLPDENAHAPNEHLDLDNFQRGVIAAASLFIEIGNLRSRG
jgi:acetylornithine deacetylase/succinyl-diaminopimelate desuccinylase-like protein